MFPHCVLLEMAPKRSKSGVVAVADDWFSAPAPKRSRDSLVANALANSGENVRNVSTTRADVVLKSLESEAEKAR